MPTAKPSTGRKTIQLLSLSHHPRSGWMGSAVGLHGRTLCLSVPAPLSACSTAPPHASHASLFSKSPVAVPRSRGCPSRRPFLLSFSVERFRPPLPHAPTSRSSCWSHDTTSRGHSTPSMARSLSRTARQERAQRRDGALPRVKLCPGTHPVPSPPIPPLPPPHLTSPSQPPFC